MLDVCICVYVVCEYIYTYVCVYMYVGGFRWVGTYVPAYAVYTNMFIDYVVMCI